MLFFELVTLTITQYKGVSHLVYGIFIRINTD
jgi:hypothetical protein